jgi:hypothetical protein
MAKLHAPSDNAIDFDSKGVVDKINRKRPELRRKSYKNDF